MKSSTVMDVFKVLRPLHGLTLLMAMAAFIETRNENGIKEYKFSLILSIVSIICPLGQAIWTALGYNALFKHQDDPLTFLNIAFASHVCTYSISTTSNRIMQIHFLNFVNRLHIIDGKLKALHINPNDGFSYKMLVTIVISEYLLLFGNIFGVCYTSGLYIAVIPILMGHLKNVIFVQAYSSVYLLYYRHKLINDRMTIIKNLYPESSRHFKLVLANEIRDLCDIHDELYVLRDIMCKAFQIQVVASILSLMTLSVVLITDTSKKVQNTVPERFMAMWFNAICCYSCLFVLTLGCSKCLTQVKYVFLIIQF